MKFCLPLLALLVLPGLAAGSNASLSGMENGAGEKVVFDSANNKMWYWDLSAFAGQTYGQQLAGIQQLNTDTYFGMTGWHLATPSDMQPLWSLGTPIIRAEFNPSQVLFEGSYQWHDWSGRFESGSGGLHKNSGTAWGNSVFGPWDWSWPGIYNLSDVGVYADEGAWVVTTVPEPENAVLLCSGTVLLLYLLRRPVPIRI